MDPAGLAPQLISTIAQRLQQRRPGEYKAAQRKGCPKGSQKTEDGGFEDGGFRDFSCIVDDFSNFFYGFSTILLCFLRFFWENSMEKRGVNHELTDVFSTEHRGFWALDSSDPLCGVTAGCGVFYWDEFFKCLMTLNSWCFQGFWMFHCSMTHWPRVWLRITVPLTHIFAGLNVFFKQRSTVGLNHVQYWLYN